MVSHEHHKPIDGFNSDIFWSVVSCDTCGCHMTAVQWQSQEDCTAKWPYIE